jgi:hypothetical protein
MGGVASALGGGVLGSVAGGMLAGPVGSIGGAVLGAGHLPGLGQALGVDNNFQGQNPVDPALYAQQIQQGQQGFTSNQANQNALAQALLNQSQGKGPNPAQNMLNQATQQNVQNAAGLIASQKGINPALAIRDIGDMTANANQQAAGQAATLGAQQQLGAQSQLGNVYGQIGGQNLQNQALLNNALLGGSLGSQNINAGVASGNQRANAGLIGGLIGGAGAMGASALGKGGVLAASTGGYVHGGEVNASGDDPSNDTVPAMLSPGEIVVPRSKSHDAEAAKAFVEHLIKDKKKRKAS